MAIGAQTKPFRHWIIDGVCDSELIGPCWDNIPDADWPFWDTEYNSTANGVTTEAKKRTCRNLAMMPGCIVQTLGYLASPQVVGKLRQMTGCADLIADPFYHGGGLHVTEPGGVLGCHIDYAIHPMAPYLERRFNLIVFLNPKWEAEWGGQTQFWNDDATKVEAQYPPKFNRGVMFETGDLSYHSAAAVCGPQRRATLAVYYLAPARPGVVRKRALWVPQREGATA